MAEKVNDGEEENSEETDGGVLDNDTDDNGNEEEENSEETDIGQLREK
ncbi:MAG TPA: hypothetical protein VFZ60_01500 [Nitrososphaeraceae archaeon]